MQVPHQVSLCSLRAHLGGASSGLQSGTSLPESVFHTLKSSAALYLHWMCFSTHTASSFMQSISPWMLGQLDRLSGGVFESAGDAQTDE